MNKDNKIIQSLLLFLTGAVFYYFLGYKTLRHEHFQLVGLVSLIFVNYLLIISYENKYGFLLGIFFRIILVFSLPNLSQDFYRFIWDGNINLAGINPFTNTPISLITIENQKWFLEKMGTLSSNTPSNYPPLSQLIFTISAFISGKNILLNVIILKSIIVLADIIGFVYLKKILLNIKFEPNLALVYFLNPLLIIECTGNMHFESIMLCFTIIAFYFIQKQNIIKSGFWFSLAILSKIIPVFFIPFLIKYFGLKNSAKFICIISVIIGMAYLPFINQNFISNYFKTNALWYGKFEFNASFFYVCRYVGQLFLGFNINAIYGKILPLIYLLSYFLISKKQMRFDFYSFINSSLLFMLIFMIMATTFHPWYFVSIIFLGVFSKHKNPIIILSFSMFLSYLAYKIDLVKETPIIGILVYSPIVLYMIYLKLFKQKSNITLML